MPALHEHDETLREALVRHERHSLMEDIGRGDWTAQLVPPCLPDGCLSDSATSGWWLCAATRPR